MHTSEAPETDVKTFTAVFDPSEVAFELGVWLMGLNAFASVNNYAFFGEASASVPDDVAGRPAEFRIIHDSLLRASLLTVRLQRSLSVESEHPEIAVRFRNKDFDELMSAIRDLAVISDSLSRSVRAGSVQWRSFHLQLNERFRGIGAVGRLIDIVYSGGEPALPSGLRRLIVDGDIPLTDRFEFEDVLPRLGTILRSLDVIGGMLRRDEPIKRSLVVFAAVFEQTQRLIEHMNNRLARYPDEEAAIFNSLDSASYSASLELKKVFRHELNGIVGVLPPPAVFARVESAYSLLLDSFQQIVIDLARLLDKNISSFEFFPGLQIKLDQSIILRDTVWQILQTVRAAESSPEKDLVAGLKKDLSDFVGLTIRFLHYKDEETFERFSEEVHAARDKTDLVPILHRFGAYLETLFGQISMRSVLAGHPFEQ